MMPGTDRSIDIPGTLNFRDLGGLRTEDGRRVRRGLLYRSGGLDGLGRPGKAALLALGVRSVCDLRSRGEAEERPDCLPPGMEYLHLPIEAGGDDLRAAIGAWLKAGGDLDAAALMERVYVDLATRYAPTYRRWLAEAVLGMAGEPLLFHCTAGKDRTGFAAAILYRVLGVSEDDILADSLLSDASEGPLAARLGRTVAVSSLYRRDHRPLLPILEARPSYLGAAFAAIDSTWGDFNAFRRATDGLGLSDGEAEKLGTLLLEPRRETAKETTCA